MRLLKTEGKKRLKILLISSYDVHGGAASACLRLAESLCDKSDMDVKLLVSKKKSSFPFIEPLGKSFLYHIRRFIFFILDPLLFTITARKTAMRFSFSSGRYGGSIINHPWVREADVIHLHWINHSFISVETIRQLQELGKPVVWTLHDMWAFTGICHYSGACEKYVTACGDCHFLKHNHPEDLSASVWKQKHQAYQNLHFIATSHWLGRKGEQSSLLKKFPLTIIPSSVDTCIFKPLLSKNAAKKQMNLNPDKIHILFGAEFIYQERKGLAYLVKALNLLRLRHPEIFNKTELVLFGKKFNPAMLEGLPYIYLGELIHPEQTARTFNACDVFIIPSLEDNLPNVVLESLACGVPVVGFNTGGIPEMVDHLSNGYLAEYKSHEDLLNGIVWVLSERDRYRLLSHNARKGILENFSYESVSKKHLEYYNELIRRHSFLRLKSRVFSKHADNNKPQPFADRLPSYRFLS